MLNTTAETNIKRAPNQQHLPPSIWTEEKTARLKEMRAAGSSYSEIATDLGPEFTRSAIGGRVYRLRLDKREREHGEPRKPRIRRANDGGAMQQRIRNKHLQKVKTIKVRSPSNGGVRVEESVVREKLPPPPEFLGIALLDLVREHCRFPQGGDGTPFTFCGNKVVSGESWCVHCYRIVYSPPRPRTEPAYFPTGHART